MHTMIDSISPSNFQEPTPSSQHLWETLVQFFFWTFSEDYDLIRENPEGLKLIAAILYQEMSGLKLVSVGSELLQLRGAKVGPGPKNVILQAKTPILTISK